MVSLRGVMEALKDTYERTIGKAEREAKDLKPGQIIEISVSGWIVRKEEGYIVDIWRGHGIGTLDEFKEMVREDAPFLELYAKSLTPTKVLILLEAYEGATESEISQAVGLRGGALHYHLRDLLHLGLLEKEGRGKYRTTKYGSFVVRSAISAIRKFRRSVKAEESE